MAEKDAEHWADLYLKEFGKESDRASVILSAVMLDTALESLLKTFLVPLASSEDNLLEGANAPISSFSARIDLTHRLGLISATFCRDLHIIRRIRNDFAHNVANCSFNDSAVRTRVIELARSSRLYERFPAERKIFVEGIKGDFQMHVSWMLWYLWDLSGKVQSLNAPNLEWGYDLSFKVEKPPK